MAAMVFIIKYLSISKRSQVISERSLVSTGSFAEKTQTAYCEKSLCCVRVQFPKEHNVERSVNMLPFT